MSEQAPKTHEYQGPSHYEHLNGVEIHQAKHELAAAHQERSRQQQIEQARTVINHVETSDPTATIESHINKPHSPTHISPELRAMTAQRALQRVRKALNTPDKLTSRLVHARPLRTVSEAGARTVARPVPLLLGGVFAFLGTSAYLLLARHIGLEYNFSVWILLFSGGFVLGFLVDILRGFLRRN